MKDHSTSETRILIVDDEPHIVTAIEFLMQQQGYETRHAYNGQEALAILPGFRPQLLILDVMMPVMNGFEVATAIRSDTRWAETQILFLTAKGTDKDKRQGYGSGADLYIAKPFDNHDLVAAVQEMLELGS